jgi:hypothetical protein
MGKEFKPNVQIYTGNIQPYGVRETVIVPANDEIVVSTTCSYFALEQTTAAIEIRFGSQEFPTRLVAGQAIQLFQSNEEDVIHVWDYVRLRNNSGANITVIYVAAIGQFIDNRITISAPLQPATPGVRSTGQVSVTNAALQIVAANTTRKSVIIRNDPLAGTTLFVGNAGVTTATGFPLLPGQSQTFEASGAIFGIRPTAVAYNTFFIDESF